MYKQFENFVKKEKLFTIDNKLLVAVSGGIDSMVLADLLRCYQANFSIAHCNFQLREKESDLDENFVKDWAKKYNICYYVINFDTLAYAKKKQLSIQIAARELRYTWFKMLLDIHNFDYIVTAHHANDQAETILYNLTKGTGIAGLRGILQKKNKLIRPLLSFSRREIKNYATKKQICWREDSSNISTKYRRNFIRHEVIPLMKTINPKFEITLTDSVKKLKAVEQVFLQYVENIKQKICIKKGNILFIQKDNFDPHIDQTILLYELIKEFGFNLNQVENLCEIPKTGKYILSSKGYGCYTERFHYIVKPIKPIKNSKIEKEIFISEQQTVLHLEEISIFHQRYAIKNYAIMHNKKTAACDFHIISYPVRLRKWKKGDKFTPLGMRKYKKVSDFLKDEKILSYSKKDIYVLLSNNEIMWVVGQRISEKSKITSQTKIVSEFSLAI